MDHYTDHLWHRGYEPGATLTSGCVEYVSTIADLVGESEIATQHLAEALQYRPKMGQF